MSLEGVSVGVGCDGVAVGPWCLGGGSPPHCPVDHGGPRPVLGLRHRVHPALCLLQLPLSPFLCYGFVLCQMFLHAESVRHLLCNASNNAVTIIYGIYLFYLIYLFNNAHIC